MNKLSMYCIAISKQTNLTNFDVDFGLSIALVLRELWVNSGMYLINALGYVVDVVTSQKLFKFRSSCDTSLQLSSCFQFNNGWLNTFQVNAVSSIEGLYVFACHAMIGKAKTEGHKVMHSYCYFVLRSTIDQMRPQGIMKLVGLKLATTWLRSEY